MPYLVHWVAFFIPESARHILARTACLRLSSQPVPLACSVPAALKLAVHPSRPRRDIVHVISELHNRLQDATDWLVRLAGGGVAVAAAATERTPGCPKPAQPSLLGSPDAWADFARQAPSPSSSAAVRSRGLLC